MKCIDKMKSLGCDFSLLFWLRNHHSLVDSEIGKDLFAFLADLDISLDLFANPDFRNSFFQKLREEFNKSGLKRISPENFVVDSGEGGKERVLRKSRLAKWPRPNQMFCFQTRGRNSAFFIYQCWQDGVRKILELISSKVYVTHEGEKITVEQIYEHCWGDTRVSRLLIDWEVETPWLSGRRTIEELQGTAAAFPSWFLRQLDRVGVLDPLDSVRCTVKDKSRAIEGGHKISFHYIFNIAGCPKVSVCLGCPRVFRLTIRSQGSHSYACKLVLSNVLDKLKKIAKEKSFTSLEDKELDQPWIGADWRTMSGSHGFSVPFSKKKQQDPYPTVPYFLTLTKGADSKWTGQRTDFTWKDLVHSIQELGEARCLRIFYQASYTPAAGDCVAYLPHLRSFPELVSLTAPGNRTLEPVSTTHDPSH